MIIIDYSVKKPIIHRGEEVGLERTSFRQEFPFDEDGMLRFHDLKMGGQVKELQLTWIDGVPVKR